MMKTSWKFTLPGRKTSSLDSPGLKGIWLVLVANNPNVAPERWI